MLITGEAESSHKQIISMTNYFPLLVAISSAFRIGVIGNTVHERVVQDELPAAVNGIRATVQHGLAGPITRAPSSPGIFAHAPSSLRTQAQRCSAFGHGVLSIYIFLPITITYRNLHDDQGSRSKEPAAGELTVS
jgi:hypothetical protein